MKKQVLRLCMVIAMSLGSNAHAQFTFSVSPGVKYNGANFGYKTGIFLPYAGIDYYGGSTKVTWTYTQFNNTTMQMEQLSDKYEFKGKVFLPTIGCRIYFLNKTNLKAFANVNTTKPIITAKFIDNGVEDPEISEYVKKFSVIGGDVGFGAEYSFAPQFSVSGEFGLRWITASFKDSYDQDVYNPNTGEYETHPSSVDASGFWSPTYSKIALNFYFGNPKVNKPTDKE
ncbi:MAG: hypothetical protein HUJ25_12985 [Crocinitomicaceae bacterium]|nr:hypothetical protein [Crocinitomicaceae bacterium]